MAKREVPYNPLVPHSQAHRTPETDMEALLMAAPHQDPERSSESLLHLRDILADAIEQLDPKFRFVFEGCVIERRSLRDLGRDLSVSKSTVDRWKQEAVKCLRVLLEDSQPIKEHLR